MSFRSSFNYEMEKMAALTKEQQELAQTAQRIPNVNSYGYIKYSDPAYGGGIASVYGGIPLNENPDPKDLKSLIEHVKVLANKDSKDYAKSKTFGLPEYLLHGFWGGIPGTIIGGLIKPKYTLVGGGLGIGAGLGLAALRSRGQYQRALKDYPRIENELAADFYDNFAHVYPNN